MITIDAIGYREVQDSREAERSFRWSKVEARTKHFWRTLPPTSFLAVNRKDWEELHERLNGGVPVPKERHRYGVWWGVLALHCAS